MRLDLSFVVMITLATACLASSCASKNNPPTPKPRTLQWNAEQAKAKGKRRAEIVAFPGMQEQSQLDEALERYSVVTAIPVSLVVQPESDTILTWYKFKVVSVLLRATKCDPCDPSYSVPRSLLPLSPNELAVPLEGGTATVDGVSITVLFNGPHLEMNEQYLLFLRGTAGSNQIGLLGGGSQEWVFRIDKQGNLHSTFKESCLLSRDVLSMGKLDLIREHISNVGAGRLDAQ